MGAGGVRRARRAAKMQRVWTDVAAATGQLGAPVVFGCQHGLCKLLYDRGYAPCRVQSTCSMYAQQYPSVVCVWRLVLLPTWVGGRRSAVHACMQPVCLSMLALPLQRMYGCTLTAVRRPHVAFKEADSWVDVAWPSIQYHPKCVRKHACVGGAGWVVIAMNVLLVCHRVCSSLPLCVPAKGCVLLPSSCTTRLSHRCVLMLLLPSVAL